MSNDFMSCFKLFPLLNNIFFGHIKILSIFYNIGNILPNINWKSYNFLFNFFFPRGPLWSTQYQICHLSSVSQSPRLYNSFILLLCSPFSLSSILLSLLPSFVLQEPRFCLLGFWTHPCPGNIIADFQFPLHLFHIFSKAFSFLLLIEYSFFQLFHVRSDQVQVEIYLSFSYCRFHVYSSL